MFDLKGIQELVQVFHDMLPSRRKAFARKQKLESALLQAQIQKTKAETEYIKFLTVHSKVATFSKILDKIDLTYPYELPDARLRIALKIWQNIKN